MSESMDFGIMGSAFNMGMKMQSNKINYKMQVQDINSKIDTLKLGFLEREGQRAFESNEAIANQAASASRRGLATGSETGQAAVYKQAQRAERSDVVNTLNRERSLLFQKEVAKFNKKQADIGAAFSFMSDLAGAAKSAASGAA
jgi:hypothetical protein